MHDIINNQSKKVQKNNNINIKCKNSRSNTNFVFDIEIDRKVLSDIAIFDKPAFAKIADQAKAALTK